jgi:hypothetical protein
VPAYWTVGSLLAVLFAHDGPWYLTTPNLPYCELCRFVLLLHYMEQIAGYCEAGVWLKTVGLNSTQLILRLCKNLHQMYFLQFAQNIDCLRAGRSEDRNPVGARFCAVVHTGPGTHPASSTMGTWSFLGVKSGRGATLTPHPLVVPLVMKE